jgi:hypothetical protein
VHTAEQKEQILQSEFQDLLADLGHHEEQSLAAMVKDVGAEKLLGKLNAVGGAKNPNRPVLSESEFNQRLNANVAKSPLMNRDFSHVRGKAT